MARKKRQFKFYQPMLVGDYKGTTERDARGRYVTRGGLERIEYEYPQELSELEEGIMGIPVWAILLGIIVVGGILYYRNKQG